MISHQIVKNYEQLFYPTNKSWLASCTHIDLDFCRCIDTVQLNIATHMVSNSRKKEFKFISCGPYAIQFEPEIITPSSFCTKFQAPLEFIDHYRQRGSNTDKPNILSLVTCDGINTFFAVSCLYLVNSSMSRERLIPFYFTSEPTLFCKYIKQLSDMATNLSMDILTENLKLIKTVLNNFASGASMAIGDYYYFEKDSDFLENYLYDNEQLFRFKKLVEDYWLSKFHTDYFASIFGLRPNAVIDHLITLCNNIRKKKSSNVAPLVEIFNDIHNALELILYTNERTEDHGFVSKLSILHNNIQQFVKPLD